jgi:hypothetical protein
VNNCEVCKHWNSRHHDCVKFRNENGSICAPIGGAVAEADHSYWATLLTDAKFGCILWEPEND